MFDKLSISLADQNTYLSKLRRTAKYGVLSVIDDAIKSGEVVNKSNSKTKKKKMN